MTRTPCSHRSWPMGCAPTMPRSSRDEIWRFRSELAKSDEVVTRILAQKPDDENALFSQVMANGLRADYAALIEKRNLASLAYMKTGRTIALKLLAIDPTCYDAYLAIGVEITCWEPILPRYGGCCA